MFSLLQTLRTIVSGLKLAREQGDKEREGRLLDRLAECEYLLMALPLHSDPPPTLADLMVYCAVLRRYGYDPIERIAEAVNVDLNTWCEGRYSRENVAESD